MGRVPTTASVQAYHWGEYELLDTPGVDAPAEHEEITEAQLAISDLVIFVIGSGGVSDELATYDSILALVEQEKRVMVVVNNTEGLRLGDTSQVAITSDVQINLQDVAARRGITTPQLLEKVPVRWVNAKSALKAQLEEKSVLLRDSGLPALANELKEFIASTNKADLTNSLAGAISKAINEALETLEAEQSTIKSDSHRRFQQRLDSEEQHLYQVLLDKVSQQRQRLMNDFRLLMEDTDDLTQARLEQQLMALTQQLTEELQDAIRIELERTGERLQEIVDALASEASQSAPNVSLNKSFSDLNRKSAGNEFREGPPLNLDSLQMLVNNLRAEHLVKAMELGKKLLPALFKGIGPKTMEKISEKVMRYLKVGGPVVQMGVQLISGIYQYYRAEQEAKENVAQQKRFQQQVQDAATRLGSEYAQSARTGVEMCITQALQPAQEQLEAMLAQASDTDRQMEQDRRQLTQAHSVLTLD